MSGSSERPPREGGSSRDSSDWQPPPWPEDGVEEAAVRNRIEARLFGAATDAVRIGRYEVGQRLGVGGMGVVYSARDPELGRLVALKVLTSSRQTEDLRHRQRLIGEARLLARLSHPNVIQIHEVGVHEGATFLALELVEGETLRTWQRRPGRRWSQILEAYIDAAAGLAAAHGVGVVHRDVKPSNILVGVDGRVRVADFGLARVAAGADEDDSTTAHSTGDPHTETTTTGAVIGTPAYMSPEQARGLQLDARSDQFSLCVSLFEALYGLRPFEARDLRRLGRVEAKDLRRLVPRASAVPDWLLKILARGLEPEPERRFSGMPAMITALREAPRGRQRRRLMGMSVLTVGLGAWGVAELRAVDPACAEEVAQLPGAWDEEGKAAIHANFRGSGLPFAEGAFHQVERSLDAAVLAWSRERRSSCVATWVEHTQSEEQLDLSVACLADHEHSLRDLAARLRSDDARIVIRAHELVRDLGDPASCNKTDILRSGPPLAPSVRAGVAALRERFEDLRVLTTIAELERARALADELVEESVIHAPLRAEALYRKALVLRRSGDLAGASRLLDEAEDAAEQSRDDRLAAEIFGVQSELATLDLADVARARVYARLYGAKLRRVAGSDATWADYHDRLAELELLDGAPDAALALHQRASELRPAEDLVGRSRNLKGTANDLAELGRHDEAIERLRAAHRLIVDELGPAHPELAVVDTNLGLSLLAKGELPAAHEALSAALDIEERYTGHDGLGASLTRLALAEVELARGDNERALAEAEHARVALERILPATHGDVMTALQSLVNIHIQRRAWGPANEVVGALIRAHQERGEPIPVQLHINAGEFLFRLGRVAESAPHFDQALALTAVEGSPDAELHAYALNGRAKVSLARGEPARALELLERALPLVEASEHLDLRAEVFAGAARALALTGGPRTEARRLAGLALALHPHPDEVPPDEAEHLRRIVSGRPYPPAR